MKLLPSSRAATIRLCVLLAAFIVLLFFQWKTCLFLYSRTPVIFHYFSYSPQEGDIISQSLPHNDLADAIEGVTHSPYSHCGVVLRENGKWVVIEAIMNVHETPLFLWEFRGRGGAFDVYRLDPKYVSAIPAFKSTLLSHLGQPYDYNYDISNQYSSYCSGLAYSAFEKVTDEKLGELQKLHDLDWKPYEAFIRTEQGGGLPLDRVMITPASLSRATQLHEVYRSEL